jgi:hypothetical protein
MEQVGWLSREELGALVKQSYSEGLPRHAIGPRAQATSGAIL